MARHHPSFSNPTRCICGEPMEGHLAQIINEAAGPVEVDVNTTYNRLSALVHEVRVSLLDQATDKNLTALAHRRRCMKLRNKIAAFYGQK